MARKQILVQIDDQLIAQLDAHAKKRNQNRSELIRQAVRAWLKARWYEDAHRRDVEAYTKFPDSGDPAWDEAVLRAASAAWAAEDPEPYTP